jgi:hypothetical protein
VSVFPKFTPFFRALTSNLALFKLTAIVQAKLQLSKAAEQ